MGFKVDVAHATHSAGMVDHVRCVLTLPCSKPGWAALDRAQTPRLDKPALPKFLAT